MKSMAPDRKDAALRPPEPLPPAEVLLKGLKPTTNVFEIAVERLGSAIKLGLYEPGDQLPTEREISEIMGVSRATVREAIRLLSEQGILVVKRGRTGGTFVSHDLASQNVLNVRRKIRDAGFTLLEILDHRLVVETGIVELAAQRADAKALAEMETILDKMSSIKDDYIAYRKLDTKFHLAIARATQTNRLPILMAEIHSELSDLLYNVPPSQVVLGNSTVQHQEIFTAIKDENPALARQIMSKHVLGTRSYLMGLL